MEWWWVGWTTHVTVPAVCKMLRSAAQVSGSEALICARYTAAPSGLVAPGASLPLPLAGLEADLQSSGTRMVDTRQGILGRWAHGSCFRWMKHMGDSSETVRVSHMMPRAAMILGKELEESVHPPSHPWRERSSHMQTKTAGIRDPSPTTAGIYKVIVRSLTAALHCFPTNGKTRAAPQRRALAPSP